MKECLSRCLTTDLYCCGPLESMTLLNLKFSILLNFVNQRETITLKRTSAKLKILSKEICSWTFSSGKSCEINFTKNEETNKNANLTENLQTLSASECVERCVKTRAYSVRIDQIKIIPNNERMPLKLRVKSPPVSRLCCSFNVLESFHNSAMLMQFKYFAKHFHGYNTPTRRNNERRWREREWISPLAFYGVSCLISLMNSVTAATPASLTSPAGNRPVYTDSIINPG